MPNTEPKPLQTDDHLAVLREYLEEQVDPERITAQARLREDLGFDSLDNIELIIFIEERYHVHIDEDQDGINPSMTLQDIMNRIIRDAY